MPAASSSTFEADWEHLTITLIAPEGASTMQAYVATVKEKTTDAYVDNFVDLSG